MRFGAVAPGCTEEGVIGMGYDRRNIPAGRCQGTARWRVRESHGEWWGAWEGRGQFPGAMYRHCAARRGDRWRKPYVGPA